MDNSLVHFTVAYLVNEGINCWDFVCRECDYRARFSENPFGGPPRLEILQSGNNSVLHTSPEEESSFLGNQSVLGYDDDDEDAWLTPDLRDAIDEITRGFEAGDS